jgi:hypothetical protein
MSVTQITFQPVTAYSVNMKEFVPLKCKLTGAEIHLTCVEEVCTVKFSQHTQYVIILIMTKVFKGFSIPFWHLSG